MSQTSLNLVAITIFTLVMSSLLGPLIHLSPAVPAIAAFSLLGLATLDTLSWNGQGGTLLLDWLARFSPDYQTRIIHHEAGHFLVAHQLGIPVTGYTLSAWEAFRRGQPGQGGVSFDTQEFETEVATGSLSAQSLDRFLTVLMAGIAAETVVYSEAQGGKDDRQQLRSLWSQLRRSPLEGATQERWAILQAKTLIEANPLAYDALVAAMKQRSSVEDCVLAIEQHSQPGRSQPIS